jgi:hypothetical protein
MRGIRIASTLDYVCLNAQRKGWAVCPTKSLPARGIEESVLGRIREAQRGLSDPAEWEQMDRTRQVEEIQAVVERIGYDGAARQISTRTMPLVMMVNVIAVPSRL